MPSWDEVQKAIRAAGSGHDIVRREALADLYNNTGRNVILYYSGWLEKQPLADQGLAVDVNDSDKNGFMATVHKLDRTKGLDLILHTPGGNVAATESIVDYLRAMFGTDIRVIVPQLAMSAGTMIALSAKSIVMGEHSSLGPTDPQLNGLPAHGVVEEFKRASDEIRADPSKIAIWQPILAKYPPTFIGECDKSIRWADNVVTDWLLSGMFADIADETDRKAAVQKVMDELASHDQTLSHARHISASKAIGLGIKVEMLEDDKTLQDLVLTIHHACSQTCTETPAFKIIENHLGVAQIKMFIGPVQVRAT